MLQKKIFDPKCKICPRLVKYRNENIASYPDWHNAPVKSLGSIDSELLVLGLAPGVKGANRTGRPFTGDHAGLLLYTTLSSFGFAAGKFEGEPDDTLRLNNCRIANAVRCVPPKNKPLGIEIKNCIPFLTHEISSMKRLKVIMALGTIAHNAALDAIRLKRSNWRFGHNKCHFLMDNLVMIDSYHCSRYNTNTGRLTEEMFKEVFSRIKSFIT